MKWKFKVSYRVNGGAVRNFGFKAEGKDFDAMMSDMEDKVDLPDDDPNEINSFKIEGRKIS
jgi:hypothetical protein